MTAADRYLRTGTEIPVIYPGTLESLAKAMRDSMHVSGRLPGQHNLFARYGRDMRLIRVYEHGECTWACKPQKS